jgi:hypothetical protein
VLGRWGNLVSVRCDVMACGFDELGVEARVRPAIQEVVLTSGMRSQGLDERARLFEPDAVKIYRDAELEQLFVDPAMFAEQGERFLAIDPAERGKHRAWSLALAHCFAISALTAHLCETRGDRA